MPKTKYFIEVFYLPYDRQIIPILYQYNSLESALSAFNEKLQHYKNRDDYIVKSNYGQDSSTLLIGIINSIRGTQIIKLRELILINKERG